VTYCDIEHVQAKRATRDELTDDTVPTSQQVSLFIEEIAGEIDTVLLTRGVQVPVTAPAAFLLFLQNTNALGAAAQAEMAAFTEFEGQQASTYGARLEAMYQKRLARLADGSAIPSGAAGGAASRVRARSYGTEYPEDDRDDAPDTASFFSRGRQF